MPFNYNIYHFQRHQKAGTREGLHWAGGVHIASKRRGMQCIQFVHLYLNRNVLPEGIWSNHIESLYCIENPSPVSHT